MRHFPVFLDLDGRTVVVSGGGAAAVAKLRLLLKTRARIVVCATDPAAEIRDWAAEGRIALHGRRVMAADLHRAALAYGADEDAAADARTARLARVAGVPLNIVDDLDGSDFITPAMVDRDPVTVAIGTEGAAPVLARKVKAEVEAALPPETGLLARIGQGFRPQAEALPQGAPRRAFWAEYYDQAGPRAFAEGGEAAVAEALDDLLARHLARAAGAAAEPGHVDFVGAGPGDPELLTLKARRALDRADVVIHDRLVAPAILELARREATIIDAGKEGFGPSAKQSAIDALIVEHALKGAHVVRLKGGDPTVFGRLDEELEAVTAAGLSYAVIPGITAASAAVAGIGQSLTRRGRNGEVRLVTGHDTEGYAEQDWAALARPGAVAAIYMGKRAARFIQGRLLMHGADPETPVTVVENASRTDARTIASGLSRLVADLSQADVTGPAILLLGLAPRVQAVPESQQQEAAR